MLRHQEAMVAVMDAAKARHDSVMSASDQCRYLWALVVHAVMTNYWLKLGHTFRRLPVDGGRDLSTAKSRDRREVALAQIQQGARAAADITSGLREIAPQHPVSERVFEKARVMLLCVRISAMLTVADMVGRVLPVGDLRNMLQDLDAIRLAPNFDRRMQDEQEAVLTVSAMLHQELGDGSGRDRALQTIRSLTMTRPDARLRLLVDLLGVAGDFAQRLALVHEIGDLATETEPGPLFSRDRIGRMSLIRDAPWATACQIDVESEYADFALDEGSRAYDLWAYGCAVPTSTKLVRAVSDWGGRTRIGWQDGGSSHVAAVQVDVELVVNFVASMEGMRPTDRGAMPKVLELLDTVVAPVLAEAIAGKEQVRIHAAGPIGELPLLMTSIDGEPLGSAQDVAYRHPNPAAIAPADAPAPYDLLVVDDSFGEDSAKVRDSVVRAADRADASCEVMRFDSADANHSLALDELAAALQRARRAVYFGHVQTVFAQASDAALVVGATTVLSVADLAALDLTGVEQLAVIGCGSGRGDMFVGDITVAHAAAMAGVGEVLYTQWPIRSDTGAEFVSRLTEALSHGETAAEFLRTAYRHDRRRAGAFAMMRP